jgi:hypothetical protein
MYTAAIRNGGFTSTPAVRFAQIPGISDRAIPSSRSDRRRFDDADRRIGRNDADKVKTGLPEQ